MDIRRATESDFLAIAALDREAWQDNAHPEFIPDGEHVWRAWVEHAIVYCAYERETLGGAILAFPCVGGYYWLHKIFVQSGHRGKGVASGLMRALLAEVDRLGKDILLTVDPQNEKALRLYESWGFTERRFVKGYYRECEDRYVLTRRSSG